MAGKIKVATIKPEQICNAWKWITSFWSLQPPAAGITPEGFSTLPAVLWLRTGLTHYGNPLGENQSLAMQVTCGVWREEN